MSEELSNSGLAPGLRAFGEDPSASEQKSTREQAERWAAAVGSEIQRISQVVAPLPAGADGGTTSCWRGGAGDLTRGAERASAADASPAPAEGGDAANERLTLSVDGGDLGALSLVVDRQQGAISVTIGVRDPAAMTRLGVERHALEQALLAQGITLNALRVVRADGLGTVLAHPRANANQRPRTDGEHVPNDTEKRRLARKLNLIG